MEQRWRQQSLDQTTAFALENKKFNQNSSAATKSFATSKSGLLKEFSTESFRSKTFADQKPAAASKVKFNTDAAAFQDRKFSSKKNALGDQQFTSRDYAQQSKSLADSDRKVSTPKANSEGKTDGYWKAFKERLDKDLSMEEVRELLNKTK